MAKDEDKKEPQEVKFNAELDKRISYPVYFSSKKFEKLLVIQDRPFTAFYFKGKEVTIEQLIATLEKAELVEE